MLLLMRIPTLSDPVTIDPPVGGTSGYGGWGFASFTAMLTLLIRLLEAHRG